jgi:hypothetical protein
VRPGPDALAPLRFLAGLPRFLTRPLTPAEAGAIVRRRLAGRSAAFLDLLRRAVYGHGESIYLALLRRAGCEYGDVERLVAREGVEGCLARLRDAGVYLTMSEFKGRSPVARGGTVLTAGPAAVRNPFARVQLRAMTSGSRGVPSPVPVDLAFVRDRAVNSLLALDGRGGLGWRHAFWSLPGTDALVPVLRFAAFGARPAAWFFLVSPAAPGLHRRYRWSVRILRLAAQVTGRPLPRPRTVPLTDPSPVARWMAATRARGETPHLYGLVSPALRLCEAAAAAGVDIAGTQLTVTGEPLTPARAAVFDRAGVVARPTYATTEAGALGEGCLLPTAADDVHVLNDRIALVQVDSGADAISLPPRSLLVSSLRPLGPFVFLNVALGDQAEVGERSCGCPHERQGWTTHLHDIRSYEKLTAGGVTFFDTELIRVLEETLPRRFGGGPGHYQLVEETASGTPTLRLFVHPAVGGVDERLVVDAFLDAIGSGAGAARAAARLWRDGGYVRVVRRPPLTTASGKILHLHVAPGAP